jgi:hypothetical protein
MPRLLLPALGLTAAVIAAVCAWQLREPALVGTHPAQEPATEQSQIVLTPVPVSADRPRPVAPDAPLSSTVSDAPLRDLSSSDAAASVPPKRLRGSDDAPVTAPMQFDAVRPPSRRFEIYPLVAFAAPGVFRRLPAAPAPSLTLDLAPGTREPLALLDDTNIDTAAQAAALDSIAEEFLDRIEHAAPTASDEDLADTWQQAQSDADSIYRNIFGEAAYHVRLMDAAIRALGRSVTKP